MESGPVHGASLGCLESPLAPPARLDHARSQSAPQLCRLATLGRSLARRRRHEKLLGTLALCTHVKACARELERSLRQWCERVVELRRVNEAVARRASKALAEGFHSWSWGVWHRRTRLLASLRESQLCKLADEHALERLWRSHCLHAWRAMRGEGAKWRRDGRLASEALRRSVLRFQLRNEWRRMLQHWRASVARAQHAAQVRAGGRSSKALQSRCASMPFKRTCAGSSSRRRCGAGARRA